MSGNPLFRYRDIYFRLIISLLVAHFIVTFGEAYSLSELLLMRAYYLSLPGSFIIAFILISLVRWITMRLDKRYDWMEKPLLRTALQLLFAIVAVSVVAFLLAALYFRVVLGINILDTAYLQFDFPVIVLLLILLNAYYIVYYFYLRAVGNKESSGREVFIVNSGARNIPLPVDEIAYFFRSDEVNYVRAVNNTDYIITQSLDEVQQQLDERLFFRANRWFLVSFKACRHFEMLSYGKLQLFVIPEFKEAVIISQKRAKSFKEWMER
ncbi:LytR/AlgR family response regulator transcription factor [Parapedobacter sp. 10938]|uniref:LytR/AlgR family response regulator transcription factor n=1 Tax=Parapedobacter flavus TaxID=3110225 RepID=UPI002DBFF06A|nr:LytTR family DNA-binding domain-containing protein [Parapedobacter sp. 10938]MEC3880218.1 LytTR family DNA-binding domain-containing protein [Parapedobacter sp. 10938]